MMRILKRSIKLSLWFSLYCVVMALAKEPGENALLEGLIRGDIAFAMKTLTKTEGESVTLFANCSKNTPCLASWTCGVNFMLIAWHGETNFPDSERFGGRLEMSKETGDLTIHRLTQQDSSVYCLRMLRDRCIKMYNLIVGPALRPTTNVNNPLSETTQATESVRQNNRGPQENTNWLGIILGILFILGILAAVLIGAIVYLVHNRKKRSERKDPGQSDVALINRRGTDESLVTP